jgi:hypothetical protein
MRDVRRIEAMEEPPEEKKPGDGESPLSETLDEICEKMKDLLTAAETLLQSDADDDPLAGNPDAEQA